MQRQKLRGKLLLLKCCSRNEKLAVEEIAITSICLLIGLAGVAAGLWWLLHRPASGHAHSLCDAIADVEDAVRGALGDAQSAQFRNVRVYAATQVAYGEVNAKNLAGVYTGFQSFTVLRDGQVNLDPWPLPQPPAGNRPAVPTRAASWSAPHGPPA